MKKTILSLAALTLLSPSFSNIARAESPFSVYSQKMEQYKQSLKQNNQTLVQSNSTSRVSPLESEKIIDLTSKKTPIRYANYTTLQGDAENERWNQPQETLPAPQPQSLEQTVQPMPRVCSKVQTYQTPVQEQPVVTQPVQPVQVVIVDKPVARPTTIVIQQQPQPIIPSLVISQPAQNFGMMGLQRIPNSVAHPGHPWANFFRWLGGVHSYAPVYGQVGFNNQFAMPQSFMGGVGYTIPRYGMYNQNIWGDPRLARFRPGYPGYNAAIAPLAILRALTGTRVMDYHRNGF